jgi:hypothetical protein
MVIKPADNWTAAEEISPAATLHVIDEEEPQTFPVQELAPARAFTLRPIAANPLPKMVTLVAPDDGKLLRVTDDAAGAV